VTFGAVPPTCKPISDLPIGELYRGHCSKQSHDRVIQPKSLWSRPRDRSHASPPSDTPDRGPWKHADSTRSCRKGGLEPHATSRSGLVVVSSVRSGGRAQWSLSHLVPSGSLRMYRHRFQTVCRRSRGRVRVNRDEPCRVVVRLHEVQPRLVRVSSLRVSGHMGNGSRVAGGLAVETLSRPSLVTWLRPAA